MGSDIFCVGKGEVTAKWMNPKVSPPPKVRPLLGPTTSWTESKTPGLTFRREVYHCLSGGRSILCWMNIGHTAALWHVQCNSTLLKGDT